MKTEALLAAIKEAEQHYWNRGNQTLAEVVLDRFFWQSLGKARGWKNNTLGNCDSCGADLAGWKHQWHRFIDHLISGQDAESFFAAS